MTNFETYLNQAWDDHATKSDHVANELQHGLRLAETNEQLEDVAWLATHVMGEHLQRWAEGYSFVSKLPNHLAFLKGSETDQAIQRYQALLQIGQGQEVNLNDFSLSDQIRICASTASALSESDIKRAETLLKKASDLAERGLDKKDPAYRSLAVTNNNLASALEEKKSRSPEETKLMMTCAEAARKFWEIAGGWLQVARAEYRLAMSSLQAENLPKAFEHAKTCLKLCDENKAGDVDLFFSYEALAYVEKKQKNDAAFKVAATQAESYFAKLSEADQKWNQTSLDKLRAQMTYD